MSLDQGVSAYIDKRRALRNLTNKKIGNYNYNLEAIHLLHKPDEITRPLLSRMPDLSKQGLQFVQVPTRVVLRIRSTQNHSTQKP